jgi:rRNA-processing protein FCF1
MTVVIVDGENVRRATWPNPSRGEIDAAAQAWASREGHELQVVWDEDVGYADDEIVRLARELPPPVWVVTSDRGLRGRLDVDRVIGGGSFARTLGQ